MPSSIPIIPGAFITEAEAEAYILHGNEPSAAQEDAIVDGINWATGYMKRATGRDLKARTHSMRRTASVTADAATSRLLAVGAAAAAAMQLVRVGDPVVVSGFTFPVHAFVTVAWDGAGVTVAGATAVTSGTGGTASFGDGGVIMDGSTMNSPRTLDLPECPLKALHAAWWADGRGGYTTIDITGALIEESIARVTLINDYWRNGIANLLIECRIGYEEPSGSTFGDPEDYALLKTISKRLTQIAWQEFLVPTGRNREASVGNATASKLNDAVPADVKAMLRQFARIGA